MTAPIALPPALTELGAAVRENGWLLAAEIVDEGLRDDAVPSLARLGRAAQLGDLPTFLAELGRELQEPQPGRLRIAGPAAGIAREHSRGRLLLGFSPREVVTEFMLLRRVLWRFVASRSGPLEPDELFQLERRINEMIDRIAIECIVAYVDRMTADLVDEARCDPLTSLLNHQTFTDQLNAELARASRYDWGITLVLVDVDRFQEINDVYGHIDGDRILHRVADLMRGMLRASDLAGRLGGDEFAVLLLHTDKHGGDRFLHRLQRGIANLRDAGDVPLDFTVTAGSAHFPSEVPDASGLLRLADQRQQAAKVVG